MNIEQRVQDIEYKNLIEKTVKELEPFPNGCHPNSVYIKEVISKVIKEAIDIHCR
jgi:predicted DNA-binding protein